MVSENGDKGKGLKDYGVIYVSGEINQGTADSVCQEIIEMNVAGKVDHIQMVINSPGGGPYAGFAIIDMMEWSRLPIYTTGLGLVASMGLMLFMAGERGRRVLTPRTAILSHRFSGITAGNHSQLLAGRKEEDMLHQRIVDHYLAYSDIPSREELETILLRDVDSWLTPQEAVRHGIADIIENLGPRSGKRA